LFVIIKALKNAKAKRNPELALSVGSLPHFIFSLDNTCQKGELKG